MGWVGVCVGVWVFTGQMLGQSGPPFMYLFFKSHMNDLRKLHTPCLICK